MKLDMEHPVPELISKFQEKNKKILWKIKLVTKMISKTNGGKNPNRVSHVSCKDGPIISYDSRDFQKNR